MTTNLIFDLDNTLLDFSTTQAHGLSTVFTRYNVPDTPESHAAYLRVNHKLWGQLERGEITRETIFATRFSELAMALNQPNLPVAKMEHDYRDALNHGHERVKGAKTLLSHLHTAGYRLFAGTNGSTATQYQRLRDSHLYDFFSGVYVSEAIGINKPATGFFDAIFAAEPELKRDNTIMIGDGLSSDIQGGLNYGLTTIWVNLTDAHNETPFKPTYEVHTLPELEHLLRQDIAS